jgi:ribosome-associated protein YbcJ (S4-like RNA binding protein)
MTKLIIKFNNDVVDHIDLKQGDMKIGRKPGSDIFLDNLSVSGEHANIFTIGEDSFLQDLSSTNGTFVNNKRITKHHLHNGDTVTIGKHTLIYVTEHAPPQSDFAKTVIINPSITREMPAQAAAPAMAAPKPAAAPALRPEQHGALYILSGANSGKRIELTKSITNLGKTGKRAGTITRAPEGYLLAAGEGGEVPKLNGRPVTTHGEHLKNGDIIEVGGTRLQFLLK